MRIGVLICVFLAATTVAAAPQTTAVHSEVSRALDGMDSQRWTTREKAFKEMPRS